MNEGQHIILFQRCLVSITNIVHADSQHGILVSRSIASGDMDDLSHLSPCCVPGRAQDPKSMMCNKSLSVRPDLGEPATRILGSH